MNNMSYCYLLKSGFVSAERDSLRLVRVIRFLLGQKNLSRSWWLWPIVIRLPVICPVRCILTFVMRLPF